jgi:hypothetical protein
MQLTFLKENRSGHTYSENNSFIGSATNPLHVKIISLLLLYILLGMLTEFTWTIVSEHTFIHSAAVGLHNTEHIMHLN